jgi:hypothetical protein
MRVVAKIPRRRLREGAKSLTSSAMARRFMKTLYSLEKMILKKRLLPALHDVVRLPWMIVGGDEDHFQSATAGCSCRRTCIQRSVSENESTCSALTLAKCLRMSTRSTRS